MRQLRIPLGDVLLDLESDADLREMPADEALDRAREAFAFLPDMVDLRIEDGEVVIDCRDLKPGKTESGQRLYDKGMAAAGEGHYAKAVDLFQRALLDLPDYADARRNLAMAFLEAGNVAAAKKHLRELLCLAPGDQWGLLLAANLFAKHEKNKPLAAKFYDDAYTLDPMDPYILTSYAALLLEMGQAQQARTMFEEGIASVPACPNPYLGLAMLHISQGEPDEALRVLGDMFSHATADDPRAMAVLEEGRRLYARINEDLAKNAPAAVAEFLAERQKEIEEQSRHGIVVVEDAALQVPSKTELAWKYGTDVHRILHRPTSPAVLPHFVARAIEHIAMESEGRATGRNMKFVATPATRELAIKAVGKDIYKLRDMGVPENALTDYVLQVINGTVMQLYNCPLDMVIEYRLYRKYPVIRPHQFVSMRQTMADNLKVIESREVRRATPALIYRASAAMNYAYATFADFMCQGQTAFAAEYPSGDHEQAGRELFELWREAIDDFVPSDEYSLMQAFASVLKLDGWFEVVPDVTAATFEGYHPPPTDQGLLKEREPAVMMYLLGALQRFDGMDPDEVKGVATEISLVGMGGITFTDPDKRFALKALPGEEFTGLQLLALMYAGWKQVEPSLDTGLDFDEMYQAALALHRGRMP